VLAPVVAGLLVAVAAAVPDQIHVMTSGGFTAAYLEVVPEFERTTGHTVVTAYGASMGNAPDSIPRRLDRGEPADVVILASTALDELVARGKVVSGSRVDLVRSSIGMVVRAGARKPDITSVEALTRTLLEATSIAYSASASGTYLSTELFPRLGIADRIGPKSRRIESERVAAVVARGDAEVGFQQISELLGFPGVEYVGPLPAEVQRVTVFSGGVTVGARNPEMARALLAFLASPAAVPAIRKSGLEPVVSISAAQPGPGPDPLVKENATVKVAAHTYVIPDGNVPAVPNVGIVVGSRATLVIDPGLGLTNGQTVLREVAKISRNAELYVGTTHYHPEHTTGYLAFPAGSKYVNSNVQEAEFAETGMQMIGNFAKRSPVMGQILNGATGRKADITFDREYTLDLGGVRVQFLAVGPTHTRGDTGFFVEGDGVLFSGDVVMKDSFLAATGVTSMKAWLAAFDTFEGKRPKTIVPSHGAVGDGSLIGINRELMQEVDKRARELKALGHSADDVAGIVQKELQAKHPGWPRANGLAAAARAAYAEAP
jgi:molybdate transport system substrate-binding protein